MSDEEVPICHLWNLRNLLDDALDNSRWGEVESISGQIVVGIKEALDPSRCQVGTPHLDGLYMIGTVRYDRAPPKSKRALNKMNRILRTAKKNMPRKGK